RVAQHLECVLELVAERADQLRELAMEIEEDSENPIGTGHFDRERQTRTDAVPAVSLLDVHEAIRSVDGVHQLPERRRRARRLRDEGGDGRIAVRANVGTGRSSGDENREDDPHTREGGNGSPKGACYWA